MSETYDVNFTRFDAVTTCGFNPDFPSPLVVGEGEGQPVNAFIVRMREKYGECTDVPALRLGFNQHLIVIQTDDGKRWVGAVTLVSTP